MNTKPQTREQANETRRMRKQLLRDARVSKVKWVRPRHCLIHDKLN